MKRENRFMRVLAIMLCLISISQPLCAFAHPQPVIIDTDVGIDDVIAMLYLLNRNDVEIKAITIASTGNSHCLPALKNTINILRLMQRDQIPVQCGRLQPLSGNHHFPANILADMDKLTGLSETFPNTSVETDYTAVDLLIKTIEASRQPVKIIAIGPLTNLAEAFERAPAIKDHIQAIYVMGGAINVPGNLREVGLQTKNRWAEWNIYLDPRAADIVFTQQIPIVLVPLDVTNRLPIDKAFYQVVKRSHPSVAGRMLYELLQRNVNQLQSKQWYFWDPLAAVIATDESIAEYDYLPVRVVTKPELKSGQTLVDAKQGQMLKVAVKVNQLKFKRLLLNSIERE